MTIGEKIQNLRSLIPETVKLIAVSKFKPSSDILEAYNAGQKDFGENYVQELVDKAEELPKDINWHFIGHLQSNKVKYIAPFVSLIHSVDSSKLLKEISKQAVKNSRTINCLLQIQIADEDTKTGMTDTEFLDIISQPLPENIHISGVMGMSTFTDDLEKVRAEFKTLRTLFLKGKEILPSLKDISMGMSGDWPIAVEEGSTLIRVGSSIFGSR